MMYGKSSKRLWSGGACAGLVLITAGFLGTQVAKLSTEEGSLTSTFSALGLPLLLVGIGLLVLSVFFGNNALHGKFRGKFFVPYLLIVPALFFLVMFVLYPILNVIYLSFFKGSVLNPTKEFIGIKNYVSMFSKAAFRVSVVNTFVYTGAMLVLVMVFSMLMALWLFQDRKLNKFAQTAIFTPHLIATVSCAFIWRWIMDFNSYGLLNSVLGLLRIGPVPWLESSNTAMLSVIIMNTWKNIGYYTLILIAAMKSIPGEIYEAAELDGASKPRRFFKITLPMISPQLFFVLILMTIGNFNVFDSINAMTEGGPGSSTEVIARFIYLFAFQNNNTLGLGSAAAVFLLMIQLALTAMYFKLLERRVHYQ